MAPSGASPLTRVIDASNLLQLIQIDRVEWLTVAQALNLAAWTAQAYTKALHSLPVMFVAMFFVGLLGGASYVNVFHVLLKDPRIPAADVEFTVQIAAIFGPTLGITMSALCILAMDNTFLATA